MNQNIYSYLMKRSCLLSTILPLLAFVEEQPDSKEVGEVNIDELRVKFTCCSLLVALEGRW